MEKFKELKLCVYHQLGEDMKKHIQGWSFVYDLPCNPCDKYIQNKREKVVEAKVNTLVEAIARKVYEIIYNDVTYYPEDWM